MENRSDKEDRIAKSITAKIINAMATIWNKGKYKASVYTDEAESHHNERHISILVSKDNETGNVAISNGQPLNGNLSQKTINWCNETLLTDENKKRIVQMIETEDFYRLDRKNEVDAHPLEQQKTNASSNESKSRKAFVNWEDTHLKSIEWINQYKFKLVFKDGSEKTCDLHGAISQHPKAFRELIDNPEMAKDVKLEPMGAGIYWNDKMGFPCDWLYENSF